MSYEIGQVFENEVSPEVHDWCAYTYETQQPCYPKEVEPLADGTRRWQIATDESVDPNQCKFLRIRRLEAYLNSTDWYAARFAETGAVIPEEVRQQRQSARDEISRLREGMAQNDS